MKILNDKSIYKYFNYLLIFVIITGSLYYAIFKFSVDRLFTDLCSVFLVLAPLFLNKTIFKLNDRDKFIYYLFVFFAYFLGSVVNLYKHIWWYDTLVHFVSGICSCYFAFYIITKLKLYDKNNRLFNFLFCVGFIFMVAGVWEILEFCADQLVHSNLQHTKETGVVDTMKDMIFACFGGVLYYVSHLIHANEK